MRSHCLTKIYLFDIWDDRYQVYVVSIYEFGETGPHGHIMKRIMVHTFFNRTLTFLIKH